MTHKPINTPAEQETFQENAGQRLARNAAYADKPGQRYIAEFLPRLRDAQSDPGWIAERIDDGSLLACPRCHFLNLPVRPFLLDTLPGWPDPVDVCQICAYAYGADDIDYYLESKSLTEAAASLAAARMQRAMTLYDLWMGPSLAADLWAMAEMGKAARRVKDLSRQLAPAEDRQPANESE